VFGNRNELQPKVPSADASSLTALSQEIHHLVFNHLPTKKPATRQSESDASHLAHAALARASAFVTRDRAFLDARERLLKTVGIDVIDVKELLELLPDPIGKQDKADTVGQGFKVSEISKENLEKYLQDNRVEDPLIREFCASDVPGIKIRRTSIQLSSQVVAIGILLTPLSVAPTALILVHVQPENPNCELFSDYLLNKLVQLSCDTFPTAISLAFVPGQPEIRTQARMRGFSSSPQTRDMAKVALGRPLTTKS
jgi:hypothetical protein